MEKANEKAYVDFARSLEKQQRMQEELEKETTKDQHNWVRRQLEAQIK